jgi:hypothetical protein
VFAYIEYPKEGGSHFSTLVGDLGQFMLEKLQVLVIFLLRPLLSLKTLAPP